MLGRNEFALRRGFAFGKTLVRRKTPPHRVGPQLWLAPIRFTQDQKRGTLQSAPRFLHFDELPLQDAAAERQFLLSVERHLKTPRRHLQK